MKDKKQKLSYTRILTIAGSDSGGGAGIQADLKTFSALGVYGMTAITTITAQNTEKVLSVFPLPASFVCEQIQAVVEDIGVDAVKIGMLHNKAVIEQVSQLLQKYELNTVVLDPVMVAESGDPLIEEEAILSLQNMLFPLATVITPNLKEAEALLSLFSQSKQEIRNKLDMEEASQKLLDKGAQAILLKGGHLSTHRGHDVLFEKGQLKPLWFESKPIETQNTHGTGCTLSSALACFLAKGEKSLSKAVQASKQYLNSALLEGQRYKIGKGHGPPHHFFQIWKNETNLEK